MNQGRLKDTHEYKHKVELMYRSSQNNEDRSRILLFNNPVPNLNNLEGYESVSRYIPSRLTTDVSIEISAEDKIWCHNNMVNFL